MIRNGIAPKYRDKIWKIIINYQVMDLKNSKGPNYYSYLCNLVHESPVSISNICDYYFIHQLNYFIILTFLKNVFKFNKQINLDLFRTIPNNIKFCTQYSEGVIILFVLT